MRQYSGAMRLLARGVGLKAIGDLMGHRSVLSTWTYLRLDIQALRGVALPVHPYVAGPRRCAMRKPAPLRRWDRAVAAFLASQRALGRIYLAEEYALNRLRQFLVQAEADDLTGPLFDAWRHSCAHQSISTRLRWERILHKFCRHRRRTEPRCFLPDPHSFVRLKPYPLPRIISRGQVAQLLAACSPRRRRDRRSIPNPKHPGTRIDVAEREPHDLAAA
jgi:site-specific recombinase XerD